MKPARIIARQYLLCNNPAVKSEVHGYTPPSFNLIIMPAQLVFWLDRAVNRKTAMLSYPHNKPERCQRRKDDSANQTLSYYLLKFLISLFTQ